MIDPSATPPSSEASLRDCDLSRASLRGARLANADLRGACLDGVDLELSSTRFDVAGAMALAIQHGAVLD